MSLDTVAGLFERIRLNLGRGSHATVLAMIPEWANLCQREICRDGKYWFNWKEDQSLTLNSGEDTIALPSDFEDDEYVFLKDSDGNPSEVGFMESLEYRREYTDQTGTERQGKPVRYLLGETNMLFRPISDATYTVVLGYWKKLADLVTGGATNGLLLEHPDVLEFGGTYRGFLYSQEYEDAKVWKDLYDGAVKKMQIDNAERQLPGEFVLSVRPGSVGTRLSRRVRRIGAGYYPRGGY